MPRLNLNTLLLVVIAFALLAGGCFSKDTPEWLAPYSDDPTQEVPSEPEPDATEPEPDATEPEPDATEPEPDTTEPEPDTTEPEPDTTEPDAETPCVPECEGKICGDDGCGQTCGSCNEGEVCSADQTNCENDCDACEAGCTAGKECVDSAIQHVQGSLASTDCNTPDTDHNLQEMYGFRGIVLITPLPTGDGGTLTFVDEGTGEQYSGIAVFAQAPDVLDWTVGDEMLFDGMHNEHMCNTEVVLGAAQLEAAQSQGALPQYTGTEVNTDELIGNIEAYEGMLINLKNPGEPIAEVFELTTDGDTEKIQVSLCDGTDCTSTIFVSAMLIPPAPDGEKTLPLPDGQEVSQLSLTKLSGILYQVGGAYHLLPRNESDLVFQCVPHCGECGSNGCGGDCGACSPGEECSDDGFCVPSSLESCALWNPNACPPGMRCYLNDTTTDTFCMEESATDSSANGQACTPPTSPSGAGPCKDEAQCLMGICSTYLCEPDGLTESSCESCSGGEYTIPFEANGMSNLGLCISAEIPGSCNPLMVDPEDSSCNGQEGHICGLTALGTGCVPEGDVDFGFSCSTDSECASGGVCRGGLCRRLCASSDTLCGMGILGEGGTTCVDLTESMGDLTCDSRCAENWTAEAPEAWQLGACDCDCTEKQCGDNGCGGVCGQCGEGDACTPDGMCVPACTPNCTDMECGDDGCGGDCGQCELNSDCVAGYCVSECQPLTDCPEGVCGQVGDGCDGFLECNTCPSWESCGEMGTCVPEPCNCVKEAGCPGNEAGSCAEGATCTYQSEASCAHFDASCDGLENCVVWSYADGGNGHAYALITHGGVGWTWSQADINAKGAGGSLATLADTGEQTFVSNAFSTLLTADSPDWIFGPWLGASQDADAQTFEDGWAWITGEPWQADDADWQWGEPNDSGQVDVEGGLENCLQFALYSASEWNDSDCDVVAKRYLLERPSALQGCTQADVGLVCAESDEENAAALGQACEQVPGAPAACQSPGQCIDGLCKAVCKTFGSPTCANCANGFEVIDADVFLGVCTQGQGCAPDCQGKTCGDDGCGGSCGSCDNWETCDDGGACVPTPCDCLDGDSCAVTFPDDCSAGTTCTYQGGPSCTQVDSGCHGMEFCHVWSLADGGNGHAYILVNQGGFGWTWSEADEDAKGRGGLLATLTSGEERGFVAGAFGDILAEDSNYQFMGPWLGAAQDVQATDVADGWSWLTGEPWDSEDAAWQSMNSEPNDSDSVEDGQENCLQFSGTSAYSWNDAGCNNLTQGYLLELPSENGSCASSTEALVCAEYDDGAAAALGEPCAQEPGGPAACQQPGQCIQGTCETVCKTNDEAPNCNLCSNGHTVISQELNLGVCETTCVPDCGGSLAADDLVLTSASPGCEEPPGADTMYVVKTYENNLFKLGNFFSPNACVLEFDYEDLSTGVYGTLSVDANAGQAGVVLETGETLSSPNSWGPWLTGTDIVVRCCDESDTTEAGQPGVDVNNATLTIFESSQYDYETFSLQAACGDDGCGGSCGECDGGANCVTSQCLCTTKTDTTTGCHQDQVWLFDSCGTPYYITNSCGFGCENGECLDCVPDCDGKACGDDGCSGSCGTCSGSESCESGECVASNECGGDQTLTADAQVVEALAGCTEYNGVLSLAGAGITDLSPLAELTSITGLVINATSVVSITLNALGSADSFEAKNNALLEAISMVSLDNVTDFIVDGSPGLTSLEVTSLQSVVALHLTELSGLQTLNGFGDLTSVHGLILEELDSLESLSGLEELETIEETLSVTDCANLEALPPLSLTSAPTTVTLEDNPRLCGFTAFTWVEDELLCTDPGCTYTYFGLYDPCDGAQCGEGCGDYGSCMDEAGMTALNCSGANEICQDNQCVYCEPNCSAKSCGDDGCGGLCNDGTCTSGSACFAGTCSALCNPGEQGCTENTCPGQMVQSGAAYACECDVEGGNCAPNTCAQAQDYIIAAPFNASYALSHDASSPSASNVYTNEFRADAAGAVCGDEWGYFEGGTSGFSMGTWPEAVWSFSPADQGFYRFVFSVQNQAATPNFTPAVWMINETQSWNGCHTLSSNVVGAECARVGAVNGTHSRLIHDQHVTHMTTFAVTFPHGTGGTLNVAITYCGNSQSDCPIACGNGVVEAGESCDDGNNMSGDACSADCQVERFVDNGDGTVTDNGPPWLGGTGPPKMWAQCSQNSDYDFDNGYSAVNSGGEFSASCAAAEAFSYCSGDDQDACEHYEATQEPEAALGINSELYAACGRMNEGLGFAGHTNWRVPTEIELARLVFCSGLKVNDDGHPNGEGPCTIQGLQQSPAVTPTIDGGLFPSTGLGKYWSSTAGDGEPSSTASAVGFGGGTYNQDPKTNNARVRCIRDTVTCTPACIDKECGGDGCGGSCGTCGAGEVCTPKHECMDPYIDDEDDDGIVIATATELMWMSCVMPAFASYTETQAMNAIDSTLTSLSSCPDPGTNFRYCLYNTNACNGGPDNYDNSDFNQAELSYGYTNQDIHETCATLNLAGYGGASSGWRVPTLGELESLVPLDDAYFQEAFINQGGNGNQPGPVYWSSTSQTKLQANALDVAAGTVTTVAKQKYRLLRCVRSLED